MANDEVTRPVSMDEFICSDEIRNHILTRIEATKLRGKTFPNSLISGSAGTGKTTIAHIIANELNVKIKVLMGPSIDEVDDIADAFVGLQDGDILFIDEFHAVKKSFQEILYTAMEQRKIPKKIDGIVFMYPIKDVCVMAATNESSNLPEPFVDRCKFKLHFTNYSNENIAEIISINAPKLSSVSVSSDAALSFATICRGTPRVALAYLEEMIDYAMVNGIASINEKEVDGILSYMCIDKYGLTLVDRQIMFALFKARKLSLASLASIVGQSTETIEKRYEPYLLIKGLILRSSGGRKLTPEGWMMIADGILKEV